MQPTEANGRPAGRLDQAESRDGPPVSAPVSPEWDEIKWFEVDGGKVAMHYGRDGEPMSLRQWANSYEDFEYRFVARTTVGPTMVITAWSGIDGDANLCLVPHIFGTIEWNIVTEAYSDEEFSTTEAEALAEHNRRVSELEKSFNGNRTNGPAA